MRCLSVVQELATAASTAMAETSKWVHKKCSGLQQLTPNPDYRCASCRGTAHPINGRPQIAVQVRSDKLEVVSSFCFLGDILLTGGGCELAVTTVLCENCSWKKSRALLPVLTSCYLSYKTCGNGMMGTALVMYAESHDPCQWNLSID